MSSESVVTIPSDTPIALRRALERMLEEMRILRARIAELEKQR
jgi:hypothetical protein